MSVETFHGGRVILHGGNCLEVLANMPGDSVDAAITDPPYHLASIVKRFGKEGSAPAKSNGATGIYERSSKGFMGKEWDGGGIAHDPATWAAVLRVLKPGAHLVAFHAAKNWHRQVCAIEDAGFEIRDCILDLFSISDLATRFLASLTIDQQQALIRIIEAGDPLGDLFWLFGSGFPKSHDVAQAINRKGGDAARYQGWGTALKPAYEPIVLARKPFRSSVADCMQEHGTGAINIDGCRIAAADGNPSIERRKDRGTYLNQMKVAESNEAGRIMDRSTPEAYARERPGEQLGRWPAHVTHDGSAEVLTGFPDSKSIGGKGEASQRAALSGTVYCGGFSGAKLGQNAGGLGDSGSAARFFYSAKADRNDRLGSKHPTIKPVDLMRWLVRMIVPPGGTVLDPFAGTGTTAQAAYAEGCNAVLIEREEEYCADIRRRMDLLLEGPVTKAAAVNDAPPDYGPLFGGGTP